MIILLHGKEEYLARRKQQEICEGYLASGKTGFSLRKLQADSLNADELKNELAMKSLFQEKKLVLLEGLFGSKDLKAYMQEAIPSLVASQTLILVLFERGSISQKDPLLAALEKTAKVHEYKELSQNRLRQWLEQEAKNLGVSLTEEAKALLEEQGGRDLWRIAKELEKLAAYAKGTNGSIEKKDVLLLVSETTLAGDIFASLDAIAAKNKTKAFSLIHRHLAKGEAPLYMLSMIHFQVRSLLEAKEQGRGWKARLAANFSAEELRQLHELLFRTDCAVKTGRLDPESAIDLFLTSAFSPGAPSEIFSEPQYSF